MTIIRVPAAGEDLAPLVHEPVTRTDIVRYAGASGDFNPIHHDETVASAAGFPTVFAMGMYPAGVLANYAADRFGPENLRAVRMRFSDQVWPGDVLTCSGSVTAVQPNADGTLVEVELLCTRRGPQGDATVAISGSARFLLP